MAVFKDLSKYWYSEEGFRAGTVNIGWIEIDDPATYPISPPSEEFLNKLWEFCLIDCVRMRGLHFCERCGDLSTVASRHGKTIFLGSAEIRVFGERAIYAAPNLIYHFVSEHHYQPPDQFVDAVLTSAPPKSSKVYLDFFRSNQLEYFENKDIAQECNNADIRIRDSWIRTKLHVSEILERKAIAKSKGAQQ